LFPKGQSRLAPGQEQAISSLRRALAELNDLGRLRGTSARVEVTGHKDADGSERANAPLSQARAERALELLQPARFDAIVFTARGVGSAAPLAPGGTELEKQRNRRASFRLVEAGSPAERGSVR
jgi:outer membrane protein OmpA-like peptidoglycan-associated protein